MNRTELKAELDGLKAELDDQYLAATKDARDYMDGLEAEQERTERAEKTRDELAATVQRVRDLHTSEAQPWPHCTECMDTYPCGTIRALDGLY